VSIAKLRSAAGFKTLDVPYKGVPLAITDVLGGQLDLRSVTSPYPYRRFGAAR